MGITQSDSLTSKQQQHQRLQQPVAQRPIKWLARNSFHLQAADKLPTASDHPAVLSATNFSFQSSYKSADSSTNNLKSPTELTTRTMTTSLDSGQEATQFAAVTTPTSASSLTLISNSHHVLTRAQAERLFDKVKEENSDGIILQLKEAEAAASIDLHVKIVTLTCCSRKTCWCFQTRGLLQFGQSELVLLLELLPMDNAVPLDIVHLFQSLLIKSLEGSFVDNLGHSVFQRCCFLESILIAGVLYFRENGQCVHDLVTAADLPNVLFMRLVHQKELPLLTYFPTRLMLRMGLEDNVYPCSLLSKRYRAPLYHDCSSSIAMLFKGIVSSRDGFLPSLTGCHVLSDRSNNGGITVSMSCSRQTALLQLLETYTIDSEKVLALATEFAPMADAHLVAMEEENGSFCCRMFTNSKASALNSKSITLGLSFVIVSVATHKQMLGLSGSIAVQVEDGVCIITSEKQMDLLLESFYLRANHLLMCDWSFGLCHEGARRRMPVRFLWRQKPKGLNSLPVHFNV